MFKSLARKEFVATNGNTLRVDIDPEGMVKFNARKGTHNQSVCVLSLDDAKALVEFLSSK